MKVLHQEKDFIIINKPAGLLVHKTAKKDFDEKTLADFLLEKFPEIKSVGEKGRCGIVHRLDRGVSGVMVVARNKEAYDFLSKQFLERRVKKEYIALVHGEVQRPDGEINFSILRKKSGEKMAALPGQEGRDASTKFVVLEKFKKYSLLKVEISTGRLNQIRVHLNAYGHPVVGDFVYRPKKLKPRRGERELGRLFLHCQKLGFYDLAGKWQEFEAGLPAELDDFLKN